MSFGGGFGGQFGQNNNTQPSAFGAGGGFGVNNPPTSAFGTTANTGFGPANTAGGLFGSGGTGTPGGFGSGGGFGATNNNAFAAKPSGFGTGASSGGMFGTTTTGGSGFGGFGTTNTTASPFGGGNTTSGGGLFGQNKPAFGAGAAPAANPFGGAATSSPFGGGTTGAFGAPPSTALTTAGAGECQGTGNVQFQPFVEKEPNSSTNQQNAFQSICFQSPYQKFCHEELRLADYAQGRRYGNSSNQPGAFGASNFGGFGATQQPASTGFGAPPATNTNAFSGAATSTGFGVTQPASTGFGGTATGAGLFGPKPATTGLFGAPPAATNTGGIFGAPPAAQPAGGLFGPQPAAQNTGGIFGNNNAAKPPFSFGTTQPAAATTGFASTTTTGGFGGLFGNNNTQQPATTGFGPQQPAASTGFGGFGAPNNQQAGGGSLFTSTAAKPTGGIFGAPPAASGGGLFGNTQPAAANPFGGAANTQTSGSLFGGAKTAAPGGSLFGNTQQANTGGGSLLGAGFGNNQNQTQQQNGGSLFGATNNQAKPGGLFGATGTQQQGGGGLFGNSGAQQQSGGLFGGSINQQPQQQQPAQNSLFGGSSSVFNTAQQNQQNGQSLTASINDNTAFSGSSSIFAPLANNQVSNPGPIATPLSSNIKTKKSAALPLYRLNSASTSRFSTPQKRPGFGFSYSNYNTPGSASSTSSTPVFGSSLLGAGSFGRTLNKSMSTSSLRRNFNTEDSILAPGAFSASPNARHYGSTGSVKKLTITRGLRHDLFSPPTPQSQPAPSSAIKKRVSFGADVNPNVSGSGSGSGSSSPLKQVFNNGSSSDPAAGVHGSQQTGSPTLPEMSQVPNSNNQLAIVREEEVASIQPEAKTPEEQQEPGAYWMQPSKEEIEKLNPQQREKVTKLVVGRKGVGYIRFESAVDLSNINLDDIMGTIVVLKKRSATVYADAARKPNVGHGLNVPSTISLEHSWPRKKEEKSPKAILKHIERLKKVADTKFVDYDKETGVWIFHVDHYTTYGVPDEEDDDVEDASEFGLSTLSAPPYTPTPNIRTPRSTSMDESFAGDSQMTDTESDPEDTFQFRKKKVLPGAFDEQELFDDVSMDGAYDEQNQESFLDECSVDSQSDNAVEEPMDQDDEYQDDESVSIMDEEMVGSHPDANKTVELSNSQNEDGSVDVIIETPGAVLRARMKALRSSETPFKNKFSAGDDWANALQATISPQKQDRALLKSMMDLHGNEARADSQPTPMPKRVVSDGRGFATSIDLMNSLFGQTRSPIKAKVPAKPKGFEWPYAKRPKTGDHDMDKIKAIESAFHNSMKPQWGPDGTLVYAAPPNSKSFGRSSRYARDRDGLLTIKKKGVVSEHRDVRFAKFSDEASAIQLTKQKKMSIIDSSNGVPQAHLPKNFTFSDFFDESTASNPAAAHENLVWQLASVLFDGIAIPEDAEQIPNIEERLRKDNLSAFWQKLVDDASLKGAALATSDEEKAIASLSGHRVQDACGHLINTGDFHLATLVALIGSKDSMRMDIRQQLNDWHKTQMLSEFSQPVRAVYEMLAGNVCVCTGSKDLTNRMESFVISKRFGLDWRQAFGLRLWYGILSNDSLDTAVGDFAEDLRQDKESAKPYAWYVEQKVPALWNDEGREEREDLLWGLLKLYTFSDSDIEDILRPENSQLSPLDTRLSWQLSRALTSSGRAQYTDKDNEKADQTTVSFAAQLTNEGSWLDAIFVLLHLSSDNARKKSIQDHLAHHAGLIGAEDSQSFITLTRTFRVPAEWIWEAKALYMRSVERNPTGEVECLIKAGSFNEAHRTFAREVAPKAVVELDYSTLRTLLHGFHGKESTIAEWHLGGEIYQDFLELLHNDKKGKNMDDLVLQRLLGGLPAVVEPTRYPSFMETVAVETISGVVAQKVIAISKKSDTSNLQQVMRLPLTEDRYLKHTVELSIEYYRGLMASAR